MVGALTWKTETTVRSAERVWLGAGTLGRGESPKDGVCRPGD